jgi:hypothetical protein
MDRTLMEMRAGVILGEGNGVFRGSEIGRNVRVSERNGN